MKVQRLTLGLALAMLLQPGALLAQDSPLRTEQVVFAPCTSGATLTGRITGRDFVTYTLGAEAGQRMRVALTSANTAAYFNLYAPGRGPGDEALAVGDLTPQVNLFDAILPVSGIYTISVYLYRNAARRGETADYRLDVSITGDTGAVVQADVADGLQGGPDFWRVQARGGLKLRSAPSTGAAVLVTLPNGLDVRNMGCRMAEGRRWCEVTTPEPSVTGWAAGDFLIEGGSAAALQVPAPLPVATQDDMLVPGTPFNATGVVDCYPAPGAARQMCDFGVIREVAGSGNGSVAVTLPGGPSRVIFYESGVPVGFNRSEADGSMAFEAQRGADGYSVVIGQARVVIPDAVIYGG